MAFRIIAVGKIKEKYLEEGIGEYAKRLAPWLGTEIIEVKEAKKYNLASEAMADEEARLLKQVRQNSYLIALSPEGKEYTSIALARKIQRLLKEGKSRIDIVIGGPEGLSPGVKERADLMLSLSRFTFSSRLARLIIMEQLYRTMKIIKKEPYHR